MESEHNGFEGVLKKIQLTSSDGSFGPLPDPNDEAEQRLTITADGGVWLSKYRFGDHLWKYVLTEKQQSTIAAMTIASIMDAVSRFFSNGFVDPQVLDVGSWELRLTNEEGRCFKYTGPLIAGVCDGTDELSEMVRTALCRNDLFMFDGNPDYVTRIELAYHRNSRFEAKKVTSEINIKHAVWDYYEHLTIDRASDTIELVRDIGIGCKVNFTYYVQEGVASFLDGIELNAFSEIIGNPPDAIDDPRCTRDYAIDLYTKHGIKRTINGSYDKLGLPTDWPGFIEDVYEFISFYGIGDIFCKSFYGKVKRRDSDRIFCSVVFEEGGRTYSYLADGDDYEEGDLVVVPAGRDNHESVARIESIEYYAEAEAPYPMDKIKRILRKYEEKPDN